MKRTILLMITMISFYILNGQIVINHNHTNITDLPLSLITQAKSNLHIAYGHTSHGSQIIDGMDGLIAFANNGGLGLSHPINTFAWNNGGIDGALDLQDYAMSGDCGSYPDWKNNTIAYLGQVNENGFGSNNPDVNVIIWSWCGQISAKYANGTLMSEYLTPMSELEAIYYNVKFVYMTGHVDHWDDANNKAGNQMIRDYCQTNHKILYDFADIESYDPDGNYYQYPHDNCDYYASVNGALLGNWAVTWQNSHTLNSDWYNCNSAHSEPLNANRKAYAAWWLWAIISPDNVSLPFTLLSFDGEWINQNNIQLTWSTISENNLLGYNIYRCRQNNANLAEKANSNIIIPSNNPYINNYSLTDMYVDAEYQYYYWLQSIKNNSLMDLFGPIYIPAPNGINEQSLSTNDHLDNVYPNPFKEGDQAVFNLKLNNSETAELTIYNIRGQIVKHFNNLNAKNTRIIWDGKDNHNNNCPRGIYLYQLSSDNWKCTKKMLLLK